MRDLAIHVTHRPGEIARVATALGRKDVNIKSIAGVGMNTQGIIRIIPDDIETAMHEPPADTRAYFRGQCLTRYPESVAAASWDSVIFDVASCFPLRRMPSSWSRWPWQWMTSRKPRRLWSRKSVAT